MVGAVRIAGDFKEIRAAAELQNKYVLYLAVFVHKPKAVLCP